MELLKRLMADEVLNQFNLVGGTALSLQIGHRKSIDLDMFSHSDFEAAAILQHLIDEGYNPSVRHNFKQTLIVEIDGIKVDFICFRYPFAQDIRIIEGIRLTDAQDIACIKIDAIMGRGKKKDFCDLYLLLRKHKLSEIMTWYQQMFQNSTLFHVYKSLTWFEDTDLDGELEVFDDMYSWEKAKKVILKAVEETI
ncbi:MAG: nucleotidyl transferase AbiEii/AbiGii toxin family protein [Chloroflexia bacterium]|nr:nucleotidyl transferase AbiEii/AbiGii toxin family protein [Chloroflexia bacterium]